MNHQLACIALCCATCAVQAGEQDAYTGIAADAATTGAALAVPGVAEANPLGWATLPMRAVMVEHAKTLPREQAQPIFDATRATGWGAATNNLLVMIGVGTAAPLVGLAVGYYVWSAGENEREFWRLCSVYRSKSPQVRCNFRPWHADEVLRVAVEQRASSH